MMYIIYIYYKCILYNTTLYIVCYNILTVYIILLIHNKLYIINLYHFTIYFILYIFLHTCIGTSKKSIY